MDDGLRAAAVGAACIALVLAAAKAHGRQVRLERERRGVFAVDFRIDNGPIVERVWRRDRRTFWPTFAAVAVVGVAWVLWRRGGAGWPWALAALAASFAAAFTLAGLLAWGRLARDSGPIQPWARRAHRGSAAWWLLVAALWVALAAAAWLG